MLNCETNSEYYRCDHTAETVGESQTNLSTRSLKRRGQAIRSVQCEVQSRGQPLHSGPPDAAVSGQFLPESWVKLVTEVSLVKVLPWS